MDFNFIDIAVVVVILITALIGFMRGFVWMAIFLATWAAAILLAIKFKDQVSTLLPITLGSEAMQTILSAVIIFVGVLIVGAIINYLFGKAVSAIGLGTFDRILGMGLGIVLGAITVSLLVMLASVFGLPSEPTWKQSKFIPKFEEGAEWIKTLIPDDMTKLIDDSIKSSPANEGIITPEPSTSPGTATQPAGKDQ